MNPKAAEFTPYPPPPVATNFSFSQIVPDFFFLNTYMYVLNFPLRVAPAIVPHLSLGLWECKRQ